MKPGSLEHRFEVERMAEPHAVHHDVGDRIVVVERDLRGLDAADFLRLCRQQERELVRAEPGEDARGVERCIAGLGGRLELVAPVRASSTPAGRPGWWMSLTPR